MSELQTWREGVTQWLKLHYAEALAGCVVGALIGVGVFLAALLSGWPLFAVVGLVFGLAFVIVLVGLGTRRARFNLTKVTLSVPGFSGEFVVNARYRAAAWEIFIETMTRVATQPLASDEGYLREALDSLYSLFQRTRSLLIEIEPTPTTEGRTVEMLALEMLNKHLRPFLSRWHPVVPQSIVEESDGGFDGTECRKQLEHLRKRLIEFARAFGELAGVEQLDSFFEEMDNSD